MRAKSFFYVCAGLFLLALGYHLGARNATAQSGGYELGSVDVMLGAQLGVCGVVGRRIDLYSNAGSYVQPDPVPGTSRILDAKMIPNCGVLVMLADGTVYKWNEVTCGPWQVFTVLSGPPTPAQQKSMGQLKVRYR